MGITSIWGEMGIWIYYNISASKFRFFLQKFKTAGVETLPV
jgi:hypothetical protein